MHRNDLSITRSSIDNTDLEPDQVANMIIERFGLVANEKEGREYRFGV